MPAAAGARAGDRIALMLPSGLDFLRAWAGIGRLGNAGGTATACVGDVTADDFGERFVRTALEAFGGLDIIVSNAGYTRDGVIQKQTDEQFQAMLDVHVSAPFRILRAAAEPLRTMARKEAAEGREVIRKVVNISSMAGTHGNAGQINYSAAKSALLGMTKTLSKEWGRLKVCVNCVAFGIIDTRLTQPISGSEASIPIGWGSPCTPVFLLRYGTPCWTACRWDGRERRGRPRTASTCCAFPRAITSAGRSWSFQVVSACRNASHLPDPETGICSVTGGMAAVGPLRMRCHRMHFRCSTPCLKPWPKWRAERDRPT